jgi:hypothetical protein
VKCCGGAHAAVLWGVGSGVGEVGMGVGGVDENAELAVEQHCRGV